MKTLEKTLQMLEKQSESNPDNNIIMDWILSYTTIEFECGLCPHYFCFKNRKTALKAKKLFSEYLRSYVVEDIEFFPCIRIGVSAFKDFKAHHNYLKLTETEGVVYPQWNFSTTTDDDLPF